MGRVGDDQLAGSLGHMLRTKQGVVLAAASVVLSLGTSVRILSSGHTVPGDERKIRGIVRDGELPIPEAEVTLVAVGGELASTLSGSDGSFVFDSAPITPIRLRATKAGYVSLDPLAGLMVEAGKAESSADVVLHLSRGAAISGTLVNELGEAIPDGAIDVFSTDSSSEPALAVTDGEGSFRVFGLPTGRYFVAYVPGLSSSAVLIDDPTVVRESLESLQLRRLPQALDSAIKTAPAIVFYPGVFRRSEAVPIDLGNAEDRQGIQFTARRARVRSVSGVIDPSSVSSTSKLSVLLISDLPMLPRHLAIPETVRDRVQLGPNGSFMFPRVAEGQYSLLALAVRGTSSSASPRMLLWAQSGVDAGDSDAEGVVLRLAPGLHFVGRLVDENGRPVVRTDFEVVLSRNPALPASLQADISDALNPPSPLARDGSFDVAGLVPGTYTVTVRSRTSGDASGERVVVGGRPDDHVIIGTEDLRGVTLIVKSVSRTPSFPLLNRRSHQ